MGVRAAERYTRRMAAQPGGNFMDHSGSITLGATAQTIATQNSGRQFLLFQNISDTTMWLNFGTTAVSDQPSIRIDAGVSIILDADGVVPTGLVSLMCATTGKKFVCKEA